MTLTVGELRVLPHRVRQPQDPARWPPVGQEAIEQAIDDLCGCAGRHNCDCVSVFNGAAITLWTDYNRRNAK